MSRASTAPTFELRGRALFARMLRRGVARGEFRPIADIEPRRSSSPSRWRCTRCGCAPGALRQAGSDQRRILRRLSRSDPQGSTVMTARKRILIAVIGVAAVLASGAFAWKATACPRAQVAARSAATARPLERFRRNSTRSSRAALSTSCASPARPSRSTRPSSRRASQAASPRFWSAKATRSRRARCWRASRPRSSRRRSTSGSRRSTQRGPSCAGRHATARTRRPCPPATSCRNRPPTRRVRPPEQGLDGGGVEAQLEVARKNLADAEVRAPFAGVVGERLANQGESLPIDGKIVRAARHQPCRDRRADAGGRRGAHPGRPARHDHAGGLRRPAVQRSGHAHQPDRAGRLALDPVYVEILDQRRRPARRAVRRWATIDVKEKAHALAVPPRRCARTTRATSCWRSRTDPGAQAGRRRAHLVARRAAEVKGLDAGMVVVAAPLPGLKAGQAVKIVETR